MTKAAELAKMGEVLTNSQIGGRRNMIINGSQMIAQRGTGAVTSNVSYPVDRWQITNSSGASISVQQNSDVPSGEGFAFCTKYTVTTADSGVTGTEDALFRQHIEGQDITQLAWGTSSAKTVTLSFYVKSSLTGTFGGALKNSDNSRAYPFTYTISSANTWEHKTITIVGETSGTWLSTNGIGVRVVFSMGSGSDRLGTAGAWSTSNNDGATGQVQVVETLNATWQITGVQFEVGKATPFEHRSFGEELQLCKRFFHKTDNFGYFNLARYNHTSGSRLGVFTFSPVMRANVSVTAGGSWTSGSGYGGTPTFSQLRKDQLSLEGSGSSAVNTVEYVNGGHLLIDAEL